MFLLESVKIREKVKALIDKQDNNMLHRTLSVAHGTQLEKTPDVKNSVINYTKNSTPLNQDLFHKRVLDSAKPQVAAIDKAIKMCQAPHDLVVHSGVAWNPSKHLEPKHLEKPDTPIRVKLPAFTSTSLELSTAQFFAREFRDDEPHPTVPHTVALRGYNSKIKHYETHSLTPDEKAEYDNNRKEFTDNKEFGASAKYFNGLHSLKKKMGDRLNIETHSAQFTSSRDYGHVVSIHIPKGANVLYTAPVSKHSHEKEVVLPRNTKLHVHSVPEIDHNKQLIRWHAKLVQPRKKNTTENG